MTRHVWRAADAGVMLWEPAAAATPPASHQSQMPQQLHEVTEADIQGK